MRPFFRLLSTLVLAAGCGPAHWVPSSASSEGGSCSRQRSCHAHDVSCLEESARDQITCKLDRSAQEAGKRTPAEVFDDLAVFVLVPGVRCGELPYDSRDELKKRMRSLLPAVAADVKRAAGEGKLDLAARRARFVIRALSELGLEDPIPLEITRALDLARAFHEAEAKRLLEKYPAASAYHACGELGSQCPDHGGPSQPLTPELARLIDARSNALGLWITTNGPEECKGFHDGIVLQAKGPPPFALTETHVHVELTRCASLPPRTEELLLRCGAQTAKATVSIDSFEITGELRIGPEVMFPIKQSAEVKTLDRAWTGCVVPQPPPFATAREALRFTFRDEGFKRLLAKADLSSDRLLALARPEQDLDRADEAFAVLHWMDSGKHSEEAEAWFAKRFGAEAPKAYFALRGPLAGTGLELTSIGFAASERFIPLSCRR